MKKTEQQIKSFLQHHSDEISTLAQQLRAHLKKETQPATELVAQSTNSVNIGYGFNRKAWDCYCAIIVYSKHINISFPSGAALPDPKKLLKGTGKRVRHIRITNFEEIKHPEVRKLLLNARDNAYFSLEEKPKENGKVETFVKVRE